LVVVVVVVSVPPPVPTHGVTTGADVVTTVSPTVTTGPGGGGGGLPVEETEEVRVTGGSVLVLGGSVRPPTVTSRVTVRSMATVVVTSVVSVPFGAGAYEVVTVVVGVLVKVVVIVLRPDLVVVLVTTGAPTVITGGDCVDAAGVAPPEDACEAV
jgi:hypothetical protein